MKLTSRQSQVLSLIRTRLRNRGFPPTRREIADALGLTSANAAESHLQALARKGAIVLLPGVARGIRLVDRVHGGMGGAASNGPGPSRGHTGPPVAGWNDPVPTLPPHPVLAALFTSDVTHLLRVDPGQGNPRDVAPGGGPLQPGDLLAIAPPPPAEGDLVTARVDGRRVVRHFERHGHWVLLLGGGNEPHPLRADLRRGNVVVDGRVVGLVRRTDRESLSPVTAHRNHSVRQVST